jgi:hypothetical protein
MHSECAMIAAMDELKRRFFWLDRHDHECHISAFSFAGREYCHAVIVGQTRRSNARAKQCARDLILL